LGGAALDGEDAVDLAGAGDGDDASDW